MSECVCVCVCVCVLCLTFVCALYCKTPFITAGSDYVPFDPASLTFIPGGPTVLCEPLMIREDQALEGTEVVEVTVSSTQVTIGPQDTVTINILDSNSMISALMCT